MKNVLVVTGTREGHSAVRSILSNTHKEQRIDLLILGCARGVDHQALTWALKHNVFFVCFVANWTRHGKAGGCIRNESMIDLALKYKDARVVGFPIQGKSKGTYHCMDLAKFKGLKVFEVDSTGTPWYY